MAAFPVWVVVPLRLAAVVSAVVGSGTCHRCSLQRVDLFHCVLQLQLPTLRAESSTLHLRGSQKIRGLIPSQFADGLGGAIRPDSGDRVGGQWKCGRWLRPTADWLHYAHVVFDLVSAVVSTPLTVSVSEAKFFLERRQPTLIFLRGWG